MKYFLKRILPDETNFQERGAITTTVLQFLLWFQFGISAPTKLVYKTFLVLQINDVYFFSYQVFIEFAEIGIFNV